MNDLHGKVECLETHLDEVEQYERRDTLIISGPSLPQDTPEEDAVKVILNTMKENVRINVKENDVSVAHRLGNKQQNRNSPMIVKFVNRSMKYDLVGACIRLKPDLYLNESLTPKRLALFKTMLMIRKEHREKFQQCHTKDGKIIVKLKNSTVRHTIADKRTIIAFLENIRR